MAIPEKPGMNLLQMVEAAQSGLLPVLYVVGSDPVNDYEVNVDAFRNTYVIVEDLFLTPTAAAADFVLPSSSPYENREPLQIPAVTCRSSERRRLYWAKKRP